MKPYHFYQLLPGRIEKGISEWTKTKQGKIILSGGQGPDEWISEGEAMYQYAEKQGVPKKHLLKETQSTNTYENVQYSYELIQKDWNKPEPPKVAIITNNYHVLRALMQAKEQGKEVIGYGSKSKFYFSLNAFLREFVAYLQMTYKVHLTLILLAGLGIFGVYFIIKWANAL